MIMLHDWKDDEDRDLAHHLPKFIMEHIAPIRTSTGVQRIVHFNLKDLQAYFSKSLGYIPEVFK